MVLLKFSKYKVKSFWLEVFDYYLIGKVWGFFLGLIVIYLNNVFVVLYCCLIGLDVIFFIYILILMLIDVVFFWI